MKPTDPDERRRVRVQYVSRGYGLALTITDDLSINDTSDDRAISPNEVTVDEAADIESDDGYLTVIASGVTTLELRRPDGGSSVLIWDETEVAWDSLRAG